jgi:hypothetical protein
MKSMSAKHTESTRQRACVATLAFAAILIAPDGLGQTGTVYVAQSSSGTMGSIPITRSTFRSDQ